MKTSALLQLSFLGALLSCALLGCDPKEEPKPPLKPAPAPQQAKPPQVKEPWFVGTWQGTALLEPQASAVDRDRAERRGKEVDAPSGEPQEFSLTLNVTAESLVGRAHFGKDPVQAEGVFNDETARVSLESDEFFGTWVGARKAAGDSSHLGGTLLASRTVTQDGKATAQSYRGHLELTKSKEKP